MVRQNFFLWQNLPIIIVTKLVSVWRLIKLCWDEVGERKLNSEELIKILTKKIQIVKERLKFA